jgi:hypothetical protein
MLALARNPDPLDPLSAEPVHPRADEERRSLGRIDAGQSHLLAEGAISEMRMEATTVEIPMPNRPTKSVTMKGATFGAKSDPTAPLK